MTRHSFLEVSERPGVAITPEAMTMLQSRYSWALAHAAGRRVLEVGSAAGPALPALASVAKRIVGYEIDPRLLAEARRVCGGAVPLVRGEASALAFRDNSFDLLLLFEAIYYLPDVPRFLQEAHRVLSKEGRLLVCMANCEWPGFNPGASTTRYWTASELRSICADAGFDVAVFGGFESYGNGPMVTLRRVASRLHVIPGGMKQKEALKRLFFGKLLSVPDRIDPAATTPSLEPLGSKDATGFRVIYAECTRL